MDSGTRKGKAEGGVENFVVGRGGRTILARDGKGKELIVSQYKDMPLQEAKKHTKKLVNELNKKNEESRKSNAGK